MCVLPWILLTVLLSAGTRLSAVDVNWLTSVVKTVKAKYGGDGQFCLAASISPDRDINEQIPSAEGGRKGEGFETMKEGDVFGKDKIIVAKPCGPGHAEHRVLQSLNNLRKNSQQTDFLLIYSLLSPCSKCTGQGKFNIVKFIYNNLNHWSDSAFVFTTVYDEPPNSGKVIPRKELEDSLCDLADSMGGLDKVYRCYKPPNLDLECHSCSIQGKISEICLDNKAKPVSSNRACQRESESDDSSLSNDSRSRSRSSSSSSSHNYSKKKSGYGSQSQSRLRDDSRRIPGGSSSRRSRSSSSSSSSSRSSRSRSSLNSGRNYRKNKK